METSQSNRLKDIRSDEVVEILTMVPNWLVRWGTILVFFIITLIAFVSWFIKYPDVVKGEIVLTTDNPPVKLVNKSPGIIRRIFFEDATLVEKGDYIAEIESPLNRDAVSFLKGMISKIEVKIDSAERYKSSFHLKFDDEGLVFGDLQTDYNKLKSLVKEYEAFKNDRYKEESVNNLKKKVNYHRNLIQISRRQVELVKKDLNLAEETHRIDQELYRSGVISKLDFFKKEKEYNQQFYTLEELKKTLYQEHITATGLDKELRSLIFENDKKERKLKEDIFSDIKTLNNFIEEWRQNYVLVSPISGKLNFLANIYENRNIQSGQALFAIIPNASNYLGYIQIPVKGVGKVKEGQHVNIKLDNYPYAEYGQIKGVVESITSIPSTQLSEDKLTYMAKVELINGLETTFKATIDYKSEMSGTGEIITNDLSVLERIFYQFRSIFQ